MLTPPPLPEDDRHHAARMFLDGDTLIAELDAVALANFRPSLWFLATTCPRGEDITIWAADPPAPVPGGTRIDYCEITLTGEGPVGGRLHNPNAEFLHRGERVDLSVNRAQAVQAYEALESLRGVEAGRQVTLFGRLTIRVTDAAPGAA